MQSKLLSCQYVYASSDEHRLQSRIRIVKRGIAKYLNVEVWSLFQWTIEV